MIFGKNKDKKKDKSIKEKSDIKSSNYSEDTDVVLYIMTDKNIPGIKEYFIESGLNVSKVFTNIIDIRNAILINSSPTRIIIIDAGTGKFSSLKNRQELVDIIGTCNKSNKMSVYYTDSIIKLEATKYLGKNKSDIEWIKYTNTANIVANTLSKKERYITKNNDTQSKNESNIEKIECVKTYLNEYEQRDSILEPNIAEIMNNSAEEEKVKQYKVKL